MMTASDGPDGTRRARDRGLTRAVSRRRVIVIAGSAIAGGLATLANAAGGVPPLIRWRGTVLGGEATIVICHPSRSIAADIIDQCRLEIWRLESLFSLYDPNSTISLLNRDGRVAGPPLDFYRLLADSRRFHQATDGAFDPTVQPLWRAYSEFFAVNRGRHGPPRSEIDAALRAVGFDAVDIRPDVVAFRRPGMALTLNGIAQGYITDRVADLMRSAGIAETLVSLGEIRALGRHPEGRPWRVRLDGAGGPDGSKRTIDLCDEAVATSAAAGTTFEPSGTFHHLLNPWTGAPSFSCRSVSVIAKRATTADAVSTALAILPIERAAVVLKTAGADRAYFVRMDGTRAEVAASGA
jgi:thiamine biosynthesis lipoprotein